MARPWRTVLFLAIGAFVGLTPGRARAVCLGDCDGNCAVTIDEIVTDDRGSRMFVCSDTDYCEGRQAAGHRGTESAAPHKASAHG